MTDHLEQAKRALADADGMRPEAAAHSIQRALALATVAVADALAALAVPPPVLTEALEPHGIEGVTPGPWFSGEWVDGDCRRTAVFGPDSIDPEGLHWQTIVAWVSSEADDGSRRPLSKVRMTMQSFGSSGGSGAGAGDEPRLATTSSSPFA